MKRSLTELELKILSEIKTHNLSKQESYTFEFEKIKQVYRKKTMLEKIVKLEKNLKEAVDVIDEYLNAGHKQQRIPIHKKAKVVYEKYYGLTYKNKIER